MFVPRHPTASQKLFFFLCSAEGFGIIPAKIFFVLSKMTRNLRVVFYRVCQVMGVITIQNSSLLDTVSPVFFFFCNSRFISAIIRCKLNLTLLF